MIYPKFIIIHYTAGFDASIIAINRFHAKRGFKIKITSPKSLVEEYINRGFPQDHQSVIMSVGYHYLIRANGKIEKGRPNFAVGAHCKANKMNFRSMGIALTGNFDSKDNPDGKKGHKYPTLAQLESLRRLLSHLRKAYSIPEDKVLLHRQVIGSKTFCPGDRFKLTYIGR